LARFGYFPRHKKNEKHRDQWQWMVSKIDTWICFREIAVSPVKQPQAKLRLSMPQWLVGMATRPGSRWFTRKTELITLLSRPEMGRW
jgi:hypothetical protein